MRAKFWVRALHNPRFYLEHPIETEPSIIDLRIADEDGNCETTIRLTTKGLLTLTAFLARSRPADAPGALWDNATVERRER